MTLSIYSVKKSFLVFPTSSGKDVSKVDLKKFFVKSCKDRGKDKDKGKDRDKDKDDEIKKIMTAKEVTELGGLE